MTMMRKIGVVIALASALALGGCKKDEEKKPDKKEEKKDEKKDDKMAKPDTAKPDTAKPDTAKPVAEAKASKEDCQKVAQHQIDMEKDESMKSAMKASMEGLVTSCMEGMTPSQAACAATAADAQAFADCILKK